MGSSPGGGGVFISNKVPAIDQAASWQFLNLSDEHAERRATWAAGTGYIPVRKSSTQTATVQKLWATSPGYKVAYNEINNGANDARHLRLGHRPLRRRAHRRAQRRELHVHPGRQAGRRRQGGRGERQQLDLELQQPPEFFLTLPARPATGLGPSRGTGRRSGH